MGDSKCCKCKDKIDNSPLIENRPPIQICFLTLLEPGNSFDPTRQGSTVVNGQDLKLGPIQKKCKVNEQCRCKCEEQECATLTGCLHWTVSIPIFSSCAALGSNTGYQSVSGLKIIIEEVCGDLSNFNPCNISAQLVEIKVQPNPCPPGSTLQTLLVGGVAQVCCESCDIRGVRSCDELRIEQQIEQQEGQQM